MFFVHFSYELFFTFFYANMKYVLMQIVGLFWNTINMFTYIKYSDLHI